MKNEQLFQELKDLAEKIGVKVSEQSFKATGVKAKSGFCKVKTEPIIILDKHRSLSEKVDVLINCLRDMPHDDIYVVPAVRERLTKKQKPEK